MDWKLRATLKNLARTRNFAGSGSKIVPVNSATSLVAHARSSFFGLRLGGVPFEASYFTRCAPLARVIPMFLRGLDRRRS